MPKAAGPRRGLPTIVKQLGAVSFMNDLASEMVYPLLPALVTTRLGGTAVALGLLDGIADAAAAALKLASGWLAERRRLRGPLVVGGYVVAAVTRPVMAIATSAWQVIGLRAADRIGKGVRNPPRDALIADAVPGAIRGRAFGFHRAMDHAGAVAGPIAAWALLAGTDLGPADVIFWSLVPGLGAVLVVAWALRKLERHAEPEGDPETRSSAESGRAGLERPRLLFGLVVMFALIRMPETLLLLRLQDVGVAVTVIPLCWAALHVIRAVASYPGGLLSDTLGTRGTMLIGWIIYAAVVAGLAVSSSVPSAVAWFLAFGLVAAATEAPERAFVAAMGKRARAGRRYGAYHAAVGLAALPGGLALGWVYSDGGGAAALGLSAAAAAALSLVGLFSGSRGAVN